MIARRTVSALVSLMPASIWRGASERQSAPEPQPASDATDADLVTAEEPKTSPSGRYVAAYAVNERLFRPTIADSTGSVVWRDPRRHSMRFGAGLLWQHDADVLWILSRDLGHQKAVLTAEGWQLQPPDDMPPEVSAHL